MYIKLTNKVKIKNPLDLADIESYEGHIENVDLHYQKDNHKKLLESFKPYGIYFDYIWFGKFKDEIDSNYIRYHFVARSNCGNIFWRKYEAKSRGSGRNELFINGVKVKTSLWMCMSEMNRHHFLELNAKQIVENSSYSPVTQESEIDSVLE
jgi:hypothetical protein